MVRPALWTAASLALGIAAAEWLRPQPMLVVAAAFACLLWAAFSRKWLLVALLLAVAGLGAARYTYAQTLGRGTVGVWAGEKITLVGTVVTEPELRSTRGGSFILQVEAVDGEPATGRVYVGQSSGRLPGYGARVQVEGALKAPVGPRTPGGFDQAGYLARKSVYLVLETGQAREEGVGAINPLLRMAVAVRNRLEGVLRATMPARDAALTAGLLLGSRSDLPDDIKEAFKASGVFHLLSVSGGNLAMVVMPLLLLLRRAGVPKRWASAIALPLVIFFVFLTGASPSVMRAGLMAALVLVGDLLRRERDAVNTLGAAGTILLLVDPGMLFDIGFQLSAGATLGILLFARRIEEALMPRFQPIFGEWLGKWLASGLSVTLAAQVAVEPISLHNFGTFSAIAPVANLLVLAFLEPVVQVGGVAALVGLVAAPVAWALNLPVRLGLWLLVFLVKATAAVPFAYLEVGLLPTWAMLLWYAGLAFLTVPALRQVPGLALKRWQAWDRRTRWLGAAAPMLLLATVLTWREALAGGGDQLEVIFLDVGQGDAMLVKAPSGEAMLIDTGPFAPTDPKTGRKGFDAGADVVLPFLADAGIRHLDYLVLTHPDLDHAGGGPSILRGIDVGTVLKSDIGATEKQYLTALQLAAEKGVPVRRPVAGERIALGPEVVLEVLTPPAKPYTGTRSDDNANCIALRLRFRQISMLFACDLEGEIEERLAAAGVSLQANLLKAAHHGSSHSTTEAFLQAVRPQYAVLSVGNGNRYGHPHDETLRRLQAHGVAVYRTDRQGAIRAVTDGFALKVAGTRRENVGYRPGGLFTRRLLGAW